MLAEDGLSASMRAGGTALPAEALIVVREAKRPIPPAIVIMSRYKKCLGRSSGSTISDSNQTLILATKLIIIL